MCGAAARALLGVQRVHRWVVCIFLAPALAHAQVAVDVGVDVRVHVPPPPPTPPPPPPTETPPAPPSPPPANVQIASGHPMHESHTHPATLGLAALATTGIVRDTGDRLEGIGIAVVFHPLDRYPLDTNLEYERDALGPDRTDHRIGYSLFVVPHREDAVAGYVVFPMGVNIVARTNFDTIVQGYVGIGGGALVRLSEHWMMSADARIIARNQALEDGEVQTLPHETVVELRASTGYYF
jgi:hypothetical protein